ncbi:MAG TPA: hypothetical protein VLX92_26760 [Kofleriaceae bacterium]|nr:hypothetical protein [Kofleriaceae bacterium]
MVATVIRVLIYILVTSASLAHASPWQTSCKVELERARHAASKIDPGLGKLAIATKQLGSDELVELALPAGNPAGTVLAKKTKSDDATDWQVTDETTSTGDYHLIAGRHTTTGSVLLVLTSWKKPVAAQLADVFRPALDACLAATK